MKKSIACRPRMWILVPSLAGVLYTSPMASQEQTGSVAGVVAGPAGEPLPGVTLTLVSSVLPGGVTAVSGSNGRFRLPAVPPGTYTLKAELVDFRSASMEGVRVRLGGRLELRLGMMLETVEEAIEVTSAEPVVSFRSSDSSRVISDEWLEKLPVGRNFTSVVTQAAGASNEGDLLGGTSIDGASGAENRYFVDGMDTTNLQNGTSSRALPTDFVEQVQVKYGGISAEYGGSTGGVISAVTKTGGGEFRGTAHVYYDAVDFLGDQRPALRRTGSEAGYFARRERDDRERVEPGFSLGGPILHDRLWFFGAVTSQRQDTRRTVTFSDGFTDTFQKEDNTTHAAANLTASFGKLYLKLAGHVTDQFHNDRLPDAAGTGSSDPDDYDFDADRPNHSLSAHVDLRLSRRLNLHLRAGHFEYDNRDSGFYTGVWTGFSTLSAGRPSELFEGFPAELDHPLGDISAGNEGTLFDFFERDGLTLEASYFVEDFAGDHELKVGGLWEGIGNDVLRGYTNTRLLFYWGIPRTDLEGVSRTGTYGHYRVLQIATQGEVSAENAALFLQDSWRPTDRLTLNLGVRAERERIPSYSAHEDIPATAIDFGWGDKIAPRLGFAYDLSGDGRWKLYGSYGVFYDTTKLEMSRGLFGGDNWVDWFFGLDTFDWPQIAESCRIETNAITAGPPAGCPGELLFAADRRHPANDPNDPAIDPNLKPLESNELTLGVERLIGGDMTVGIRYVRKELERTVEDVGVVAPGIGEVFFISNPGEGIARDILGPGFPSQPRARRDYDALTLTFRKSYSRNWGLNASYTYSRLYGNYSGLASSDEDGRLSPNVNRFFDSLHGSFDAAGRPVYGRLASDRPHQLKVQVMYTTPWRTTIGVRQRLASGTPVSTEYTVSPGLPFFPYGRGDLGRTPTITRTELLLAHDFELGGRFDLQLNLTVNNLFDEDTAIDIYYRGTLQDLPLSEEAFFAGFDPEQVIEDNAIPRDPRYGFAEQFQGPRSMRFGVKLSF